MLPCLLAVAVKEEPPKFATHHSANKAGISPLCIKSLFLPLHKTAAFTKQFILIASIFSILPLGTFERANGMERLNAELLNNEDCITQR